MIFSAETVWKLLSPGIAIYFINTPLFDFWLLKLSKGKKYKEINEILFKFGKDSQEYDLIFKKIPLDLNSKELIIYLGLIILMF